MGLVKALAPQFLAQTGATIDARYGAVGAMKEALQAGAPCDVMLVTDAMVSTLTASGALQARGRALLGRVRTGVAVPLGAPLPDVSTAAALKAALLAASALYFPDPERATAGIHFAKVMRELGVHDALAPRFCTHPNGATAMREMAAAGDLRAIGCTQVSEILYTEGVALVGALPDAFELATPYTVAVSNGAADSALAQAFIALLAGASTQDLRAQGGFQA
jgi:molybdate transport system substrate-binding protein